MPSQAHNPWPAVRVLAQVVGLREAARRFAEHGVTEAAARKRSQREGWAQDGPFGKTKANVTTSPPAATAAQVMAGEMRDLSGKTRLGLARGVAKAAEHVATRTGAENLEDAQNVKAAAQTANLIHGWQDQPASVRVRLDVLHGNCAAPVIDIESYPASEDDWEY